MNLHPDNPGASFNYRPQEQNHMISGNNRVEERGQGQIRGEEMGTGTQWNGFPTMPQQFPEAGGAMQPGFSQHQIPNYSDQYRNQHQHQQQQYPQGDGLNHHGHQQHQLQQAQHLRDQRNASDRQNQPGTMNTPHMNPYHEQRHVQQQQGQPPINQQQTQENAYQPQVPGHHQQQRHPAQGVQNWPHQHHNQGLQPPQNQHPNMPHNHFVPAQGRQQEAHHRPVPEQQRRQDAHHSSVVEQQRHNQIRDRSLSQGRLQHPQHLMGLNHGGFYPQHHQAFQGGQMYHYQPLMNPQGTGNMMMALGQMPLHHRDDPQSSFKQPTERSTSTTRGRKPRAPKGEKRDSKSLSVRRRKKADEVPQEIPQDNLERLRSAIIPVSKMMPMPPPVQHMGAGPSMTSPSERRQNTPNDDAQQPLAQNIAGNPGMGFLPQHPVSGMMPMPPPVQHMGAGPSMTSPSERRQNTPNDDAQQPLAQNIAGNPGMGFLPQHPVSGMMPMPPPVQHMGAGPSMTTPSEQRQHHLNDAAQRPLAQDIRCNPGMGFLPQHPVSGMMPMPPPVQHMGAGPSMTTPSEQRQHHLNDAAQRPLAQDIRCNPGMGILPQHPVAEMMPMRAPVQHVGAGPSMTNPAERRADPPNQAAQLSPEPRINATTQSGHLEPELQNWTVPQAAMMESETEFGSLPVPALPDSGISSADRPIVNAPAIEVDQSVETTQQYGSVGLFVDAALKMPVDDKDLDQIMTTLAQVMSSNVLPDQHRTDVNQVTTTAELNFDQRQHLPASPSSSNTHFQEPTETRYQPQEHTASIQNGYACDSISTDAVLKQPTHHAETTQSCKETEYYGQSARDMAGYQLSDRVETDISSRLAQQQSSPAASESIDQTSGDSIDCCDARNFFPSYSPKTSSKLERQSIPAEAQQAKEPTASGEAIVVSALFATVPNSSNTGLHNFDSQNSSNEHKKISNSDDREVAQNLMENNDVESLGSSEPGHDERLSKTQGSTIQNELENDIFANVQEEPSQPRTDVESHGAELTEEIEEEVADRQSSLENEQQLVELSTETSADEAKTASVAGKFADEMLSLLSDSDDDEELPDKRLGKCATVEPREIDEAAQEASITDGEVNIPVETVLTDTAQECEIIVQNSLVVTATRETPPCSLETSENREADIQQPTATQSTTGSNPLFNVDEGDHDTPGEPVVIESVPHATASSAIFEALPSNSPEQELVISIDEDVRSIHDLASACSDTEADIQQPTATQSTTGSNPLFNVDEGDHDTPEEPVVIESVPHATASSNAFEALPSNSPEQDLVISIDEDVRSIHDLASACSDTEADIQQPTATQSTTGSNPLFNVDESVHDTPEEPVVIESVPHATASSNAFEALPSNSPEQDLVISIDEDVRSIHDLASACSDTEADIQQPTATQSTTGSNPLFNVDEGDHDTPEEPVVIESVPHATASSNAFEALPSNSPEQDLVISIDEDVRSIHDLASACSDTEADIQQPTATQSTTGSNPLFNVDESVHDTPEEPVVIESVPHATASSNAFEALPSNSPEQDLVISIDEDVRSIHDLASACSDTEADIQQPTATQSTTGSNPLFNVDEGDHDTPEEPVVIESVPHATASSNAFEALPSNSPEQDLVISIDEDVRSIHDLASACSDTEADIQQPTATQSTTGSNPLFNVDEGDHDTPGEPVVIESVPHATASSNAFEALPSNSPEQQLVISIDEDVRSIHDLASACSDTEADIQQPTATQSTTGSNPLFNVDEGDHDTPEEPVVIESVPDAISDNAPVLMAKEDNMFSSPSPPSLKTTTRTSDNETSAVESSQECPEPKETEHSPLPKYILKSISLGKDGLSPEYDCKKRSSSSPSNDAVAESSHISLPVLASRTSPNGNADSPTSISSLPGLHAAELVYNETIFTGSPNISPPKTAIAGNATSSKLPKDVERSISVSPPQSYSGELPKSKVDADRYDTSRDESIDGTEETSAKRARSAPKAQKTKAKKIQPKVKTPKPKGRRQKREKGQKSETEKGKRPCQDADRMKKQLDKHGWLFGVRIPFFFGRFPEIYPAFVLNADFGNVAKNDIEIEFRLKMVGMKYKIGVLSSESLPKMYLTVWPHFPPNHMKQARSFEKLTDEQKDVFGDILRYYEKSCLYGSISKENGAKVLNLIFSLAKGGVFGQLGKDRVDEMLEKYKSLSKILKARGSFMTDAMTHTRQGLRALSACPSLNILGAMFFYTTGPLTQTIHVKNPKYAIEKTVQCAKMVAEINKADGYPRTVYEDSPDMKEKIADYLMDRFKIGGDSGKEEPSTTVKIPKKIPKRPRKKYDYDSDDDEPVKKRRKNAKQAKKRGRKPQLRVEEQPSTSDAQPEQPSTSDAQPEQPSTSDAQPEQPSTSDAQPEQPSTSDAQPEQPSTSDIQLALSASRKRKLTRPQKITDQ